VNMAINVYELGPPPANPPVDAVGLCSGPPVPRPREPALEAGPDGSDLVGLVLRARAGDLSAQSNLIQLYRPRLAGFVRLIIRDRETVKDIVQAISAKLVRRLPGLRDPIVFESWLFTLARNTALDHLRSSRRRPVLVEHETALHEARDPIANDGSREILEAVESALRGTSSLNRRILRQIIAGASYRQVATAEGISISALKVRLHRVRQELRQQVGGPFGDSFVRQQVSGAAFP
jgi:RNA polymerase sigma-70 factor (ECF subfamily)